LASYEIAFSPEETIKKERRVQMTTKMIIIIAIAVLATVGTYLFGKMAEKNDSKDDSSKKEG
jgi:uncharacterized ion transporter superfamily protein YfcC